MATKKYIIENRTTKLLRTDNEDKAFAKVTDLIAANEPWFKLTDNATGIIDTYSKEPGQQNYRVQGSKVSKT